jgi:hypothetical protein
MTSTSPSPQPAALEGTEVSSRPDHARMQAAREVALLILDAFCSSDPSFTNPDEFHWWIRRNKPFLRSIFYGQGISNLYRVTAWLRAGTLDPKRYPRRALRLMLEPEFATRKGGLYAKRRR